MNFKLKICNVLIQTWQKIHFNTQLWSKSKRDIIIFKNKKNLSKIRIVTNILNLTYLRKSKFKIIQQYHLLKYWMTQLFFKDQTLLKEIQGKILVLYNQSTRIRAILELISCNKVETYLMIKDYKNLLI